MSDNLTAIIIVFMCVLGPVWITFHYVGKGRTARQLNAQDAAAFEQLAQTAARMESRMATLERILDSEVPGWRNNAAAQGEYYGKMG
jgi:phage shock protein B